MVEIGYFSFCFALLLSFYSFITGIICLFKPYISLLSSSRNALVGVFLCVLFSSLILWGSIFLHDFSIKYVYLHSSIDMPPIYLFTSFWSALEGSHLLWTLLLSMICAFSICLVRKSNAIYYPSLCVVYAAALIFMLILNVTVSPPLTRLLPVGKFGQGMNALLQNPYMAIHPPMLFTGYSLLVVPFAYSVAALVKGYFTLDWFITVRRVSLLAWGFLTTAIFLGGKWAYFELGWGGYWAWDPVENSSFMPWLALTASIHTFLIYTKTKRLPRLGLFLSMLAFALSFEGTFITRSGIISSVHSFAESNIGPTYLIWVVFLLSVTLILVFTRGNLLEGASVTNEWIFAKETMLLFTNFFLLFLLALVFIGTILPLVIEAIRGVKISIQQPFFNSFAPWIGLGFVSILGIGNLMKWRSTKIEDPISCIVFPFLWSGILTICLSIQKNFDFKTIFAYFMILWTSIILIMDLIFKLKDLRWNAGLFVKYNRAYLGALIIHLGFLMALLGFTGNYQTVSAEVNLNLHQSTNFYGYKITNQGLSYQAEYNVQYVKAQLDALNNISKEIIRIVPMRSKFTNNEQWFNEVGVYSTFWHDLYIVLSSFDVNSESISLKIGYNPTVKFVWTSLIVMMLGALIALTHSAGGRHNGPIQNRKNISIFHKLASFSIFIGVLSLLLFAYSGIAFAQDTLIDSNALLSQGAGNGNQFAGAPAFNGEQIPMQMNPKVTDIAKELRCPTCIGLSVLDSGTPQSVAMRIEIAKQVEQGKSKQEIINYFKEKYGEWILREPDFNSSYGFLIWLVPILGFIGGPVFLVIGIKNSQKRKALKMKFLKEEINQFIFDMRKKTNL